MREPLATLSVRVYCICCSFSRLIYSVRLSPVRLFGWLKLKTHHRNSFRELSLRRFELRQEIKPSRKRSRLLRTCPRGHEEHLKNLVINLFLRSLGVFKVFRGVQRVFEGLVLVYKRGSEDHFPLPPPVRGFQEVSWNLIA